MRKYLSLLAALLLILSPLAMRSSAADEASTASVYAHGLELVSLLTEAVQSEAYSALYSPSSQLKSYISKIAPNHYDTPNSVYRIVLDSAAVDMLLPHFVDVLSPALKSFLLSRLYTSLPNQLNGAVGTDALAVAGIFTINNVFVCPELTRNELYLFTYADAVPVAITFLPGADGAVWASACFVFDDNAIDSIAAGYTDIVTIDTVFSSVHKAYNTYKSSAAK